MDDPTRIDRLETLAVRLAAWLDATVADVPDDIRDICDDICNAPIAARNRRRNQRDDDP